MSFDSRENSQQLGEPVELYEFVVYNVAYRYTSAAVDQLIDAVNYEAWPLSRGEFEETDELPKNDLTIDCSLDFPILSFFESAPPSDVIRLTIRRWHRGEPASEALIWWQGYVLDGDRAGNQGKLNCENKFAGLKQTGLRRPYSAVCPHVLYGAACKKVEADVQIEVTVDGVTGFTLQSSAFATYPDDRFAGGIVYWEPTPGRVEKRGIKSHVGNTIELTHTIPGLEALDTIKASPGCAHTRQDCNDFFNNIENHGGWPFIKQNPMGSSSVF